MSRAEACSRASIRNWAPFVAALLVWLASCGPQSNKPYPARQIRLIVQAAPGGLSDAVSRVIASQMEPILGVPVVCENRPGAAGALAFLYVVRRAPDGYTLGHGSVEIAMVRALGLAQVGPEDMDLLCLVSMTDPALAVHRSAPWQTLEQFLAAARARPGYYIVANSGTGSIWHINALLMEEATGTRFVHCPFGGSAAALTALLGKHVDAVVAGTGEVAPHVKAGSLRALAIFARERSPILPEVPAVTELGWEFGTPAWSGFYGPRGLPARVRDKLVRAMRAAFESEPFQRLCQERGMRPVFLAPDAFQQFAAEQARFFATTIPRLVTRP